VIHLLRERTQKACLTKCQRQVEVVETTAWWREVTCPDCQALMGTKRQRKLVRLRRDTGG
jgi:hypothetical protein